MKHGTIYWASLSSWWIQARWIIIIIISTLDTSTYNRRLEVEVSRCTWQWNKINPHPYRAGSREIRFLTWEIYPQPVVSTDWVHTRKNESELRASSEHPFAWACCLCACDLRACNASLRELCERYGNKHFLIFFDFLTTPASWAMDVPVVVWYSRRWWKVKLSPVPFYFSGQYNRWLGIGIGI